MQPQARTAKGKSYVTRLLVGLTAGMAVVVVGLWQAQNILDWWRLRDYSPPARVAAIAVDTTMTDYGRHLFYVNQPQLLRGEAFNERCTNGAEKTVVLGCYVGGDQGIFLYSVTDERLDGVIETTAAHEMLHAAYHRLSLGEKRHVDSLLNSYYQNILDDERIEQTIDAYRESEPNELLNEMHSIFATEIQTLPEELEDYYARYFTSRTTVAETAARYEAEFTTRRNQAKAYDTRLIELRKEIDDGQEQIDNDYRALTDEYRQMESRRTSGDVDGYNELVEPYNQKANAYNDLLVSVRQMIAEYNDIVEKYNALALETRELTKALNSQQVVAE